MSHKEQNKVYGPSPLSSDAILFAKKIGPVPRAHLAYYAFRNGRIGDEDLEKLIGGDDSAQATYQQLSQEHQSTSLGTAFFNLFLQAYQPRVNRKVPDFHSRYSLAGSLIEDDPFIERVRELDKLYEPSAFEGEGIHTVLGDAVRHNLIPLIALGEVLSEDGAQSPLSLSLPESYFRLVKNYYPKVFDRLKQAHQSGALDVGLSNAHHSIAPLLSRDDLKNEYDHSLKFFLKHFNREGDRSVTLHIPEQALTLAEDPRGFPDLLEVLDEVQKENNIQFTVYLDSKNHNRPHPEEGFNIATATHLKYPGQAVGTNVIFRAFNASQDLAFDVVEGGDPLSNQARAEGTLEGLSSEREREWSFREADRVFGEVVGNIFGIPAFHAPVFSGESSIFPVEMDAEWAGYHNRGEPYALYRAIQAMREFGIEPASAQKALSEVSIVEEAEKRPQTASWSNDFGLWINPNTQWLRDIVSETLTAYKKPMQLMTDILLKGGKDEEELPKVLNGAWRNYGLSLISCPYWWSANDPNYPKNVPVVPELFRNMVSCGRGLQVMLDRMTASPETYGVSPEELELLGDQQGDLKQAYASLIENPSARQFPEIAKELDKGK
ncbi:MAG: hypothetical protein ABH851_05840 [Methanobacteriota archaeon]